jgi:L-ribulose-5-phosphate 4-epimerase
MTEAEGVIKFNLEFEEQSLVKTLDIAELSAWRSIFKDLGLIGQDPDRYDGYGFGNISMRLPQGFLISGTQTGGLDQLELQDYAHCLDWDLAQNVIRAIGSSKPSSESLSHAAVYDVQSGASCAFHVHSPELWRNAASLGIETTDPGVPYGTPEMAREVERRLKTMASPGIFSMGGHEDGIFTFGASLKAAGCLMIEKLSQARMLLSGSGK